MAAQTQKTDDRNIVPPGDPISAPGALGPPRALHAHLAGPSIDADIRETAEFQAEKEDKGKPKNIHGEKKRHP